MYQPMQFMKFSQPAAPQGGGGMMGGGMFGSMMPQIMKMLQQQGAKPAAPQAQGNPFPTPIGTPPAPLSLAAPGQQPFTPSPFGSMRPNIPTPEQVGPTGLY